MAEVAPVVVVPVAPEGESAKDTKARLKAEKKAAKEEAAAAKKEAAAAKKAAKQEAAAAKKAEKEAAKKTKKKGEDDAPDDGGGGDDRHHHADHHDLHGIDLDEHPHSGLHASDFELDCGAKGHLHLSMGKCLYDRDQKQVRKVLEDGTRVPRPYCRTRTGWHIPFGRTPCCKNRKCCIEAQKSDFEEYGVGISLYFKYLKTMTIFFFLLTLLNIPALVVYTTAGVEAEASIHIFNFLSVLSTVSVGNLREGE